MIETGVSSVAKRGRPKTSQRDDVGTKLDRGIVEKAKFVALRRKMTLVEYLSKLLDGLVDADYRAELKRMTKNPD